MILTVTLNPALDLTVFGKQFFPYQTNRGDALPPDPGGKGNNAARVARLLGSRVVATGFLGGFTGDFISLELHKEGIEPAFFPIGGTTRFTVSFLDDSGRETKIVPSGPEISNREIEGFLSHVEKLLESYRFSVVVLSGSLPRGVPEDIYGQLIEAARAKNTLAILDASGQPLALGIEHSPFLIKPNLEEARELVGNDDMDVVTGFFVERSGPERIVALTMGGEGVLFFTGDEVTRIRSKEQKQKNPVGAGDSFVGGFASAFDQFGDKKDVLFAWAAAAGTACARSSGLLFDREFFEACRKELTWEKSTGGGSHG